LLFAFFACGVCGEKFSADREEGRGAKLLAFFSFGGVCGESFLLIGKN
jgi:hypothetical protein